MKPIKIKFALLTILVITSAFNLFPKKSAGVGVQELIVLKTVLLDKDFQSYLKNKKIKAYPITLKYANKGYVLTDPASRLEEVPLHSFHADSCLSVRSFGIVHEGKVKVKLDFLDRKFRFTAIREWPQNPCSDWIIRSFLARKAGEVKPDLFMLK